MRVRPYEKRRGSSWQSKVDVSVIQSDGSGGCNGGTKKSSVVNMSSGIRNAKMATKVT